MRHRGFKRYFAAGIIVPALMIMPARVAEAGLRFNGKDDCIVAEKPLGEGLQAITLTMWVKGEYKHGNLLNGAMIVHFLGGPNGFYLSGRHGPASGYLNWDKDITASGRWQHLTAVWGNPSVGDGKMKLYVDGIRQATTRAYDGGTNGVLPGWRPAFCGVFNSGIGPFQGELEDLRIYNRALTDEEVLAVYSAEGADGVTNGMALWFPMKDKKAELMTEGDVCLLQDRSGNGNHGKITGIPVWKTVDDEAAQKRRGQIKITCENLGRIKAECAKQRQLLTNWFEEHPDGNKKWRTRFEELNRGLGWTPDALRGEYDDLYAEIELQEILTESGPSAKESQKKVE